MLRDFRFVALALFASWLVAAVPAKADMLDDIIANGVLRCAVTLDFPPMGFRDENNEPVGFDVDTCNDIAKILQVEAEIIETPFPDRIPALVTGRADIGVASTSDTLERAKTIGFSIPYFVFQMVVLTREGLGIDSYESLKGHRVGSVSGTYEAIRLEADVKKWGEGSFRSYQTQADVFLALAQGQIDGTSVTNTVAYATVKSGKFDGLMVGGYAPYVPDFVSLIAPRQEYGLLRYLSLFVNQQVRTGRYQELYNKWIGEGDAPNLTIENVYY